MIAGRMGFACLATMIFDGCADQGKTETGAFPPFLEKPQNITASNTFEDRIELAWDAVDKASQYVVFRSEANGETTSALGEVDATTYVDAPLEVQQTFYYYVIATASDFADSPPSDVVLGRTILLVPLDQTVEVSASDGIYLSRIELSWQAVTNAEGYEVEVAQAASGPWSSLTTTTATAAVHAELASDQTRLYRVRATAERFHPGPYSDAEEGSTTAEPVGFDAYFKASNTDAGDAFGSGIAISADGNTMAVGALYESSSSAGINGDDDNNSTSSTGAVYVFVRDGARWSQEAYVKASNPGQTDLFGSEVALSADGNTLAVAARRESSAATGVDGDQADDSATAAGAAYVFVRDATTWTQQAYIKASNTAADDGFGIGLALSGDGDTLAVGAVGESSGAAGMNADQNDNSADAAGAVYVFTRNGTSWSQQAYVKSSNPEELDRFGYAIDLSDVGHTMVVGAWGEKSAATGVDGNQSNNTLREAGAAYVFFRDGTTWSQQAYLKPFDTNEGDWFGMSVAVSKTGNTVAVGAPKESSAATGIDGDETDNSASESGAVYVYSRTDSIWIDQSYIKASNTSEGDGFGWSVELGGAAGELLATGAIREDGSNRSINGEQNDGGWNYGAVYLFADSGGNWSQYAYIKAPNARANYELGNHLALSADGNMLAAASIAESSAASGINADWSDHSAAFAGAAYTFEIGDVP